MFDEKTKKAIRKFAVNHPETTVMMKIIKETMDRAEKDGKTDRELIEDVKMIVEQWEDYLKNQ